MDFFNNVNTIVSIIAGFCTIFPVIMKAFSKRKAVQNLLNDPSISITVRQELEDKRDRLTIKMINGIIRGSLTAIIITVVIIFLINFFFVFKQQIELMKMLTNATNPSQAKMIFDEILSNIAGVFSFSNPLSIIIGAFFGILCGISVGLSALTDRK